jgi:hypothetical protein
MTDYKPGDIVNGHRLTEAGEWVPVSTLSASLPAVDTGSGKKWFTRWWGILLILGGALIALILLAGLGSDVQLTAEESGDPANYTCEEIIGDAVKSSAAKAKGTTMASLLKVRAAKIVTDNRETYKLPKGTGEATVLTCEGTGVWSDNTTTKVRITATIDSDGQTFIASEIP